MEVGTGNVCARGKCYTILYIDTHSEIFITINDTCQSQKFTINFIKGSTVKNTKEMFDTCRNRGEYKIALFAKRVS